MDLNSINSDVNLSILQTDVNFIDLEHHGFSMAQKQRFLESQLQELRTQIKTLTSSKMELEMTLNRERRELADVKAQLKVIQGTMQYWEQERSSQRDTVVTQKLQLESLQEERILYDEQLKNLEDQNIKLKLRVENLEKLIRNQSIEESLLNSKKKTVDVLVEKVYCENQKLEKEFASLKKRVASAKYFGEQMIILLKNHHNALKRISEENESLIQSKTVLERELKRFKSDQMTKGTRSNENSNEIEKLNLQLRDQEEKINILNHKLMVEAEEKKELEHALKNFIKEQINFSGIESYLGNSDK